MWRLSSWAVAATLVGAVACSGGPSDEAAHLGTGSTSGAAQTGEPGGASTGPGDTASTQPTATSSTGDPPPSTGDPTHDSSDPTSGGPATGPCSFPAVADFAAPGPFEVTREAGGAQCTVYRPTTLGEAGRLHPVIVWGNGTTLTPSAYDGVLRHWASHGFIVAAANTSNAGTGAEMLGCLDWVLAQDADPSSPYAATVDREHAGASGHSQGGGGSLMAGQDARITVTAPLQPYTEQGFGGFDQSSLGAQNGPMFLMSGEADTIAPRVPNQQRTFDAANVPVFWGTLAGADHLFAATGDISGYRGPSTAWFRYHLMCDEDGRALFYDACTLCTDPDWEVETKNW